MHRSLLMFRPRKQSIITSLLLMPLLLHSTHRLLYLIRMSSVRFMLRKRTWKSLVARILSDVGPGTILVSLFGRMDVLL